MYVLYMYVFICLMYCANLSDDLLPKLEPTEYVKPCVIIVCIVKPYGQRCRLSPVCTVAVPCIFFVVVGVVVIAVAGAVV